VTLRVAITRASADAERTAERVRELGAEPILAPLLAIIPCGYDTNVEDAQALLFTSANGVRAFPDARRLHAKPVLTVGDATAEAARAAGFIDVRSADGDVSGLAALVATTLEPSAGKLIHISGDHAAGDLAGVLRAAGFSVERRVAYAAHEALSLPEAFRQPLDIVLFHSPRAAETFVRLGAPNAEHLTAACLSPAVAEAAACVKWARIVVSPAPREDALLRAALRPDSPAGASA
jgi:uroporphyrinogen-III synthase